MRLRMHEIAQTRIRYGYRRVHIMLKREGWSGGRNLGLSLVPRTGLGAPQIATIKKKKKKKKASRYGAQGLNEAWSLDFVHDQLSSGQSFRALTIIDILQPRSFSHRSRPALARGTGGGCT